MCVHLADRFTPSIFFPVSTAIRPFPQKGISAVVSEALAWASPWRVGREQHYSQSWRIHRLWRCSDPLLGIGVHQQGVSVPRLYPQPRRFHINELRRHAEISGLHSPRGSRYQ